MNIPDEVRRLKKIVYYLQRKIIEGVGNLLSALSDVEITSPTDGQVLTYDNISGKWKNETSASGYTDEQAQDAIGNNFQDTDTIDLVYNDATPSFTANLKKDFSSGLISGAVVTINGGNPARIDISSGTGVIVDFWTTPGSPVLYPVTIAAQTNLALTYLATSTLSFIGVDKNGTIVQYNSEPTNSQRRDIILLAQIGHTNNTSIGGITSFVSAYGSSIEQLRDIISELHLISDGNIVSPNGTNLKINKSNGYVFGLGVNFRNDPKNPHRVNTTAQTAATFRYRTQTGGGTGAVTDIDPTTYDNAGTATAIGGGVNQATNQRIYLNPNGTIIIQYGQTIYTSLSNAISGVQNESFVRYTNVEQASILIGILSVTKGCTNLSDTTNARFLRVSRLGEEVGSAAGISVSTLQSAYNNALEPEILTDSTHGAVTIKRGSAADTDDVLEVKNGSDIIKFQVTGEGKTILQNTLNEAQGIDIASAATTDIGAATGNYVNVTGTTTITSLGTIQAGTRRIVNFTGILTLTYNATSLILPTSANITTAAGDVAVFVSLGSGNWKCVSYTRLSGQALVGGGGSGTINSGAQYRIPYYSTNPSGTTLDAQSAITANKIVTSDSNGLLVGSYDFKDEDDMASNSATALPSQQSVKSYVDNKVVTESQYAKIQAIWYHLNSF